MLIIRDMEQKDEAVILEMMQDFYNSPACLHTVPEENFRRTLTEASAGNPCVRVLILEEKEGQDSETPALPLGYAHFTVSWNNEAGGKQIWFDADICLLSEDTLELKTVIAKGRIMVKDGKQQVFGTFERK